MSIAALNAAALHSQWGLMLVSGLLSVVVGLIAMASLAQMALAMVWVLGAWALLTGVFEMATALTSPWIGSRKWMLVGAVSLVWIMGGYALLIGVLFVMMGFLFKNTI